MNFSEFLSIGEENYGVPERLDEILAEHREQIAEAEARGEEWIGLFMAHPCKMKCTRFNDALIYADGRTREIVTPPMVSEDEYQQRLKGFRRAVRFYRDESGVEMRPVGELARMFNGKVEWITRDELVGACRPAAVERPGIAVGDAVSPGGRVCALADAVVHWARDKSLPDRVRVVEPLGPMEEPQRRTDVHEMPLAKAVELADEFRTFVAAHGHLPANLQAGAADKRIGIGALYGMWASLIVRIADSGHGATIEGPIEPPYVAERYPDEAYRIEAAIRRDAMNWPIHDLHLPLERISRYARAQAWTLRPALRADGG